MKFQSQSGAAAIEFAIILPLLVMLVFGIIEFSIAFFDKSVITNASREGARRGILFDDPRPSEAEIANEVNTYIASNLITFGSPSPASTAVTGGACATTGNMLTVSVTYQYNYLVIPEFVTGIAGPLNMNATTVMRCE